MSNNDQNSSFFCHEKASEEGDLNPFFLQLCSRCPVYPRTTIQHLKSHQKTQTHLPTTCTTFIFFTHSKENSGYPAWEASHMEDKIQPFGIPPSEYLSSLFLNKKNHRKIGENNFYANRTSFSSLLYTKHFPEFSSF